MADSQPTGEVPTHTTGLTNDIHKVLQTAAVAPEHGSAYEENSTTNAPSPP